MNSLTLRVNVPSLLWTLGTLCLLASIWLAER